MRGASESLKNSVISLLCRPDFMVGTAVTEFGNLTIMGVIRFQGGKSQVVAFNCQRQGACGYCNGQQSQSSRCNRSTPENLRCWLVVHCVHRSKIDRKITKFLIYISRKVIGQMYKNST